MQGLIPFPSKPRFYCVTNPTKGVMKRKYSKSIAFEDINYQLAQADDKTAIFENWCDFLNYFDASVNVQLSFINQKE